MKIKTYIINLKESVDRKERISKEVCAYPFMDIEWTAAVDGRKLSEKETERLFDTEKFIKRYHRPPVKGEIGCTLSHRKCYEQLLATNRPYALILEDDVAFTCPEDTKVAITEGVYLLEEQKADIVLFVSKALVYNRPSTINQKYSAYSVCRAYGTYAYLINKEGAKRLLEKQKEDTVADDFQVMQRMGIRIKTISPSITTDLSNETLMESLIEKEREETRNAYSKLTLLQRLKMYAEIIYHRLALKCGLLQNKNFY